MKRFKIVHQTNYSFVEWVQLLPHTLRMRPREGHELRIESSALDIVPLATLRWHRDVEGNSVAVATFSEKTKLLSISSEVVIQKFDLAPQNFLVAEYALDYPFNYLDEDKILLEPYICGDQKLDDGSLREWIGQFYTPGEQIQSFALLLRLNQKIYQSIRYCRREEEGVQSPTFTLQCGSGSCRDSASLFMAAARQLGFAARFVSGYVYSNASNDQSGSTHAWAEVFLPGAGWKGFDPTTGDMVGAEHIAVAVARSPAAVPPVAGNFFGNPSSTMTVNVWVVDVT